MGNVVHFGARSSNMEMTTNEREIIKAIHELDKNFDTRLGKLETKIYENINGGFKDNERRIGKLEDNQRWLVMAVLGAIVAALMQIVIK